MNALTSRVNANTQGGEGCDWPSADADSDGHEIRARNREGNANLFASSTRFLAGHNVARCETCPSHKHRHTLGERAYLRYLSAVLSRYQSWLGTPIRRGAHEDGSINAKRPHHKL